MTFIFLYYSLKFANKTRIKSRRVSDSKLDYGFCPENITEVLNFSNSLALLNRFLFVWDVLVVKFASKWWYVFQLIRGFFKTSTILKVYSEASGFPGVILHPEDIFGSESHAATARHLPLRRPHLPMIFSTPRDPLCLEGFSSESKVPIAYHPWFSSTVM